jgi:hypothetical protein
MLQKGIKLLVSGGKPTRAGLHPVRKFSSALRQATGRGARTSIVSARSSDEVVR